MAGERLGLFRKVLTLFYLIHAMTAVADGLQCVSNNKSPVDWFIAYKLPGSEHNVDVNSFFYMDADQTDWTLSAKTLDDPKQAIAYTLDQIYTQNGKNGSVRCDDGDILYAMYNDERPEQIELEKATNGHTKGVIGFDEKSGFWLIHSTPKFPPVQSQGYDWPATAKVYGQTFLCISMATNGNLNEIGKQFLYNYPDFYDKNIPSFGKKYTDLVSALDGSHVSSPPWNRETTLESLGGVTFTSFAKSAKFEADLYSVWLAPRMKSTLLVETWQNGRKKMCSNCTGQYKVYNIAHVQFPSPQVAFKETQDHAKWTVTNSTSSIWTCIGDINRQCSQMSRPGGTVCLQNKKVWSNFHAIISDWHDCNTYSDCVKPGYQ